LPSIYDLIINVRSFQQSTVDLSSTCNWLFEKLQNTHYNSNNWMDLSDFTIDFQYHMQMMDIINNISLLA
jgi:hypothetical protein